VYRGVRKVASLAPWLLFPLFVPSSPHRVGQRAAPLPCSCPALRSSFPSRCLLSLRHFVFWGCSTRSPSLADWYLTPGHDHTGASSPEICPMLPHTKPFHTFPPPSSQLLSPLNASTLLSIPGHRPVKSPFPPSLAVRHPGLTRCHTSPC
jgi:hypothetical protein